MDTTAAAELGGAAALGGATYWAMDHHHRQNYDDDEPDVNDGPPPWTPPDHRRRFSGGGGGEPPLKRSKQNQPYDPFEPSSNGNHQVVAPSRSASADYGQGSSSGTPPPPEPAASASSSGGGAAKINRVAIGRMFFKTKLCCKFRTGTCPYVTNCNFAHGMEELRKPPPNWQEIVAQQEEDLALRSERDRERDRHRDRERRINGHVNGAMGGSAAVVVAGGNGNGNGEASSQRFHKTRFCKKYYTEEGCPYGERCNFLHDDQGRSRESVAINLGPTTAINGGGGNEILNSNSGSNNNSNIVGANSNNGASQKPMYWKTRICNKWETTGHCPFGDKCHFAHGVAELQKYGGGFLDSENGAASGGLRNDLKQSASSLKPHTDPIGATYSVFGTDNYSLGVLNQRSISNFQGQRQGQRAFAKWKGPDKISQIYGDWIEDNEWEYTNPLPVSQHEEVNQIHGEETYDAQLKKVEKWQNGSQGQTNIQFGKGGGELENNRNNLSRDGGKGEDMTSSGGKLDQVYLDVTFVGEL